MAVFSNFLINLGSALAAVRAAVDPAPVVPPSAPVLALPVLWCAECGDEVGGDVCYSVGGNVVFCGSRCRAVWEDVFNEF